jgi:hypothetical protein
MLEHVITPSVSWLMQNARPLYVFMRLNLSFDYYFLPARHTRGGILVTWHASVWVVTHVRSHTYSVSAQFKPRSGGHEW